MIRKNFLLTVGCSVLMLAVPVIGAAQMGSPPPGVGSHEGVSPTWDKILTADDGDPITGCDSSRFKCVLNNEAVLDLETGLVWDKSPSTQTSTWFIAIQNCSSLKIGGRLGWSLPMVEQLVSLVDRSNDDPAPPTGHPFLNVQSGSYWTATTRADIPTRARFANFDVGGLGTAVKTDSTPNHSWCVRGGQTFDGNTHTTHH